MNTLINKNGRVITPKLLALDLDGTLLTTEKELTAYTKTMLGEMIRQGVYVVPTTGRPYHAIPKSLTEFPGIRYGITANGAVIMDFVTGEPVYSKTIPKSKAKEVLDLLWNQDAILEIYYNGIGYAAREKLDMIERFREDPASQKYVLQTRVPVENLREKFENEPGGLDKIQAIFAYEEDHKAAMRQLEQLKEIYITGSVERNCEIGASGVSKANALKKLTEILKIDMLDVIAFGDSTNDTEMLVASGYGVAMENAWVDAKQAADAVTLSNDCEGVAKFLENLTDN